MSYTPPPHNQLSFAFSGGGYVLPSHNHLRFSFNAPTNTVTATGWDSSQVSAPIIGFYLQGLSPSGWASSFVAEPSIINFNQLVLVGGIAAPPQTGPNGNRQVPDPMVALADRSVSPTGIGAGVFGSHDVSHDVRFIDLAGRGVGATILGVPTIAYRVRYIEPPFIASNAFGLANVAFVQVLLPSGWASSTVSTDASVDINLQRLLHHSGVADPAGYGATHVRNQFEVLRPNGWLSETINFPVVRNKTTYLFVQPYMDTNSDPTQWPTYGPYVANINRFLGPGGWQSSRLSVIGTLVENAARQVSPDGFDATLWGPSTFIAYRDRAVAPHGLDSFYSLSYTVVYNGARTLQPTGWTSTETGIPVSVVNLNRSVKHIFPYDGEQLGTAFIAPAIRTITQGVFNDPAPSIPEVRHNPYPILPAGIAPRQVGGHAVEEHFNIVSPSSANVHPVPWVGEPVIENRNKTPRVFPSDQSLYGLPRVFNSDIYADIGAGDLLRIGSHQIVFRTRQISVSPITIPTFSVTHRIRNVIPDPPGPQRVEVPTISVGTVPFPALNYATIFPDGIARGAFGVATVRTNAIRIVRGIFELDQLGVPVLSATQYVYPKSLPLAPEFGTLGDSDTFAAKPRVTPHTIYAPASDMATNQAVFNHGSIGMVMDFEVTRGVGSPTVSNYIRTIGPVPKHISDGYAVFGVPSIELRVRYVYPAPIRSLRMGFTRILGTPQFVNLDASHNGFNGSAIGAHLVARPVVPTTPTLYPPSINTSALGSHTISLFNREISPQGIPHRGNPEQGFTNPWGVPMVGYPRIYVVGGGDLSLWGTAWASYKNRELPVQGWNSLTLEDEDLGSFADRMRVSLRNPAGSMIGFVDSVFGVPTVTFSLRSVLGRGIEAGRAGVPNFRVSATITPSGWDSLVVGDIDKWEPNKIKAHGDDVSVVGMPRLLHPLRPSAAYDGIVGTPRIGVPVYPTGISQPGVFGPSVTNPFGCTNRVVTPLPILSQEAIPEPTVHP